MTDYYAHESLLLYAELKRNIEKKNSNFFLFYFISFYRPSVTVTGSTAKSLSHKKFIWATNASSSE